MAGLLTIILWLLVVVLVVALAVIVTPIWLYVHLATTPRVTFRVEVSPFGGFFPRIPLTRSKKEAVPKPSKPKRKRKKRQKSTARAGRMAMPIGRLIADLFRKIHLESLRIDGSYGMKDPADTGQIAGLLMPVAYAAPLPPGVVLGLRPDFTRACLEGELSASIRLTVAAFVPPFVRFGWRAFGPGR